MKYHLGFLQYPPPLTPLLLCGGEAFLLCRQTKNPDQVLLGHSLSLGKYVVWVDGLLVLLVQDNCRVPLQVVIPWC